MQVHAYCGYSHFLKSEGPVSSLQLQSCLILSLNRPPLFSYLWLIISPLSVKYVSVYSTIKPYLMIFLNGIIKRDGRRKDFR